MVNDKIERFYRDIQGLDIKSPVSAIAAATGENKGNVSKYLNRKMTPSESFLSRFYLKYGEVVQHRTTAPETPQNGHQNSPGETPTLIGDLLNEIQYRVKPKPSIEDIATHIGVVRTYLNDLKNGAKPHSERIYNKLKEGYKDILNDMTTSTKLPAFEMSAPQTKDATILNQSETVKTLADTSKSQQETIKKLVELLAVRAV